MTREFNLQQPDVIDKRNMVQIALELRRGLVFQLFKKKKNWCCWQPGEGGGVWVGWWVGGGADGDGVDVLCWVIGLWSGGQI